MKAIGSQVPLLFAMLALPLGVQASACKPLGQSQCQTSKACTWVGGYTRKDGRKVNAYCRAMQKPRSVKKMQAKAANP